MESLAKEGADGANSATWLFGDGRQQTVAAAGDLSRRLRGGHALARSMGTTLVGWHTTWRTTGPLDQAEQEELAMLEALIAAAS